MRARVPVTCRGAGTGLSGGAVPCPSGLVLATPRLRAVYEVSVEDRLAVVEPGVVNLALSRSIAATGLCYAPDPSSQRSCTIGGNVAENSGGPHCLKYGVTCHHLLGLEVLLPEQAEPVRLGGRALDAPGYDLLALVCGSEGTLALVTAITVRLTPLPEQTRTLLAVFADVRAACEAVSRIIRAGIIPAALEMIDRLTISAVEEVIQAGYPSDAEAVLLIELDGLSARPVTASPRAFTRRAMRRSARASGGDARRRSARLGSWPRTITSRMV